MFLVPDFGKVAGDLKLDTLVQRGLPRTFFPDTLATRSATAGGSGRLPNEPDAVLGSSRSDFDANPAQSSL